MDNPGFDLAVKAMTSLEMYSQLYASSDRYQKHISEVLSILRESAECTLVKTGGDAAKKKFLLAFADALEISNKPGEYVPLSKQ